MNFNEKLKNACKIKSSHLCIGLDPEKEKLPEKFNTSSTPYYDFNREIIDNTNEYVAAYKPQFAHYAAFGREKELELTIKYIKENFPDILIILDSKRGDIGNTASYYAKESFERYQACSVTINPYMGYDCVEPFVKNPSYGAFILCKTSNTSSSDFQNLELANSNNPLFLEVARKVKQSWNTNKNCGLVVGATYPEELRLIRKEVGPDLPFLVPGVGAQGGSVKDVINNAYGNPGSILINSSRGIIHKDFSNNFAAFAKDEAKKLSSEINTCINLV